MAKLTRGFTGRGRDARATSGCRPASTTPATSGRCSPPRRRRELSTDEWTFTVDGHVEQPTTWTWDEIHALPPSRYDGDIHCVTTWSKLGHDLRRCLGRRPARGRAPACRRHPRARVVPHRLHHQPAARRRDRRAGVGRVRGRRRAARRGPRRARAPARAAPLLLEEREVGRGPDAPRPRRARASGSATATTIAATPGSSSATRATDGGGRRRVDAMAVGARRGADPTRPPTRRPSRSRSSSPSPTSPGQHYVVRLTAPDGYTASRSYSVASAPDDTGVIELTVERLDDGEVSTFLHDVVEVGDELEVRGPIGGWFVWDGATTARCSSAAGRASCR